MQGYPWRPFRPTYTLFADPLSIQESARTCIEQPTDGWTEGDAVEDSISVPTGASDVRPDDCKPDNNHPPLLTPFKYQPPNADPGVCQDFQSTQKTVFLDLLQPFQGARGLHRLSKRSATLPRRRLTYKELNLEASKVPSVHVHQRRASQQMSSCRYANKNCQHWVEDVQLAHPSRPWQSDPFRRKSRIWLGLTKEESSIEEAQVIKMAPSPERPRVTSISRSGGDTASSIPTQDTAKSGSTIERSISTCSTNTAQWPLTAQEASIESHMLTHAEDCQHALNGLGLAALAYSKESSPQEYFDPSQTRQIWAQNSSQAQMLYPKLSTALQSTLDGTGQAEAPNHPREASRKLSRKSLPCSISPTFPIPQGSDRDTSNILSALENTLADPIDFPFLQFNNSLTQKIREANARQRYHSSRRSSEPLRNHPPPQSNPPALPALHRIFPTTPSDLLSSLYATFVAVNFVSCLPPIAPSRHSQPTRPFSSLESWLEESSPTLGPRSSHLDIPPKARAILGMGLTQPASPTRPKLPSAWVQHEWEVWRTRVHRVKVGLEAELAELWEEIFEGMYEDERSVSAGRLGSVRANGKESNEDEVDADGISHGVNGEAGAGSDGEDDWNREERETCWERRVLGRAVGELVSLSEGSIGLENEITDMYGNQWNVA